MAATIWLSYRSSDRLLSMLGAAGARVVSRLSAFLLLCLGVQIMLSGLADFLVRYARSLDDYDYNYTLCPYHSGHFDPFTVGATILSVTKKLKAA